MAQGTFDEDAPAIRVPHDGSARSPRALLDQLDHASVEVTSLALPVPDLDDVDLVLTGQPDRERTTVA